MARYREYSNDQTLMLPVKLEIQLQPETFECTINTLGGCRTQGAEDAKKGAGFETFRRTAVAIRHIRFLRTYPASASTVVGVPASGGTISSAGIPVSYVSFPGCIALAGITINDSVVLIDAAVWRFRAIIMTTITTAGGMAPLILQEGKAGSYSSQSPFQSLLDCVLARFSRC